MRAECEKEIRLYRFAQHREQHSTYKKGQKTNGS